MAARTTETTPRPRRKAALVTTLAVAAGLVLAASAYVAFAPGSKTPLAPSSPRTVGVEMHTKTGLPPVAAGGLAATSPDGALGLVASATTLAFGEIEPGRTSAPVSFQVTNTGSLPFSLVVSGTALVGPGGERLPASSLAVATDRAGVGVPLGAPEPLVLPPIPVGSAVTLWVTLTAPSGADAYVPAGDYAGFLQVSGVSA